MDAEHFYTANTEQTHTHTHTFVRRMRAGFEIVSICDDFFSQHSIVSHLHVYMYTTHTHAYSVFVWMLSIVFIIMKIPSAPASGSRAFAIFFFRFVFRIHQHFLTRPDVGRSHAHARKDTIDFFRRFTNIIYWSRSLRSIIAKRAPRACEVCMNMCV